MMTDNESTLGPPAPELATDNACGYWFEDFRRGLVIRHPITRTITEGDNVLFSTMTMNPQPLHIDEAYASRSRYGTRIVNGILTLGMTIGITVSDLTLHTSIAVLALEDVRFVAPVFHGDTLHVETEVLMTRASCSRPEAGIVTFEHRGRNQDDAIVLSCRRIQLIRRRHTDQPGSPA